MRYHLSIKTLIATGALVLAASPWGWAADMAAKAYPIKDVAELAAGGNLQLDIRQTGSEYLRIEALPEVLERVKVEQEGARLKITVKHKDGVFNWFKGNNDQVQVVLQVKQLNRVELSGAANANLGPLQVANFHYEASGAANGKMEAITTGKLAFGLSGASNLHIQNLEAKQLWVNLSGASNLEVKQGGKGDAIKADASGASNLRARALRVAKAELDASGASHIDISVSDELDAEATGASSINYYGAPKAKTHSSGAGHVNAREADEQR